MIVLVLGDKWSGIVYIFKMFCGVQLFKVLASYHKVLLTAKGHARQILQYDIVMALLLISAVYVGATTRFEYTVYAWGLVYPTITVIWIITSLSKLNVSISRYIKSVFEGTIASLVMAAVFLFVLDTLLPINEFELPRHLRLAYEIVFSIGVFGLVIFVFQKQHIIDALKTLKK